MGELEGGLVAGGAPRIPRLPLSNPPRLINPRWVDGGATRARGALDNPSGLRTQSKHHGGFLGAQIGSSRFHAELSSLAPACSNRSLQAQQEPPRSNNQKLPPARTRFLLVGSSQTTVSCDSVWDRGLSVTHLLRRPGGPWLRRSRAQCPSSRSWEPVVALGLRRGSGR